MFARWFTTTHSRALSLSLLLLRLTIGGILFVVGAGKLFGWFGGFGPQMTIHYFSQMGISAPLAYLSSYTEFIGGSLLAIGFLTRPSAFAVSINMLVATILTLPKGFIMGMAAYPFTFFVVSVVILIAGPLYFSVDHLLFDRSV